MQLKKSSTECLLFSSGLNVLTYRNVPVKNFWKILWQYQDTKMLDMIWHHVQVAWYVALILTHCTLGDLDTTLNM